MYSTFALPRAGAAAYKASFWCLLEYVVVDNARHTAVNFVALMNVLAQISAVAQNALKAVFIEFAAFGRLYAPPVQIADKLGIVAPATNISKTVLTIGASSSSSTKLFSLFTL